jgi:hypothetical protein
LEHQGVVRAAPAAGCTDRPDEGLDHGLGDVLWRWASKGTCDRVAAAMLVGRAYARPDAKCLLLDPTLSRGSAEPLMPSVEGDR